MRISPKLFGFLVLFATAPLFAADPMVLAQEHLKNGEYRAAIDVYTTIIEGAEADQDDRFWALTNRALAYRLTGQLEEALQDATVALSLRQTPTMLLQRGAMYSAVKEYDDALADFDLAIQLDPEYAEAYYNRGNVHRALGDLPEAIKDYERAIEYNDSFEFAHLNLADCYADAGMFSKALRHYDRAVEVKQGPVAYLNRGNFHLNHKRIKNAIADYTEVIKNRPDWGYPSRAHAYSLEGDFGAALDDLDMAIQINAENPEFLMHRGSVHAMLGNDAAAVTDFTRTLELDATRMEAYLERGSAQLRLHHFEQAVADLVLYTKANPGDRYAQFFLYIASARAHGTNGALPPEVTGDDSWEDAVARFLRGTMSEESLLLEARTRDAESSNGHRCEAFYYIGQSQSISGDSDSATRSYQAAIETGESSYIEFLGARAEFQRRE